VEVEEYSSKIPNNEITIDIHPNPACCPVTVSYELKQDAPAICRVYDAYGRVVRDLVSAHRPAAKQRVTWDRTDQNGRPIAAGVYFVRVQTGTSVDQIKLVIVD
jgi:flagellar hook assembly protein FlgD